MKTLIAACFTTVALASVSAAQGTPADTTPPHAWISRVSAIGTSGTQLTGLVHITPSGKPNEYKVTIDLRGAKLGNKIPWSIGTGNCGEASSVELGDRVGYRMIEASADGTAHANSTLKVTIPPAVYHVDFFAGPADRERVVSCGPLVEDR